MSWARVDVKGAAEGGEPVGHALDAGPVPSATDKANLKILEDAAKPVDEKKID